ncbi:hypothetical protein C8N43_2531 [Litoreibacter ponti]|uniref:Uncharacterized protein n=1 Tax=Litoreibacter ponti TaxID=1510457 RepID=A0A2T6BP47_9RHOB|nr:hypothetical protein [Litoreibacter ponti]PTX57858.1 hypothetical protein C8N43_2531 [Litoreibacter ponti]
MPELRSEPDVRLGPLTTKIPSAKISWKDTVWTVTGAVLEGAWSFGSELLVATTDDVPYEDMLHLCLLAPNGSVIEEVSFGGMYATGSFELLGLSGPTLQFRFINHMDWQAKVLDRPKRRFPYFGDPAGVSRAFGFSTRVDISTTPTA